MDVNIKNNINKRILELLDEDNIDKSKKIKILNGSYNNSNLLFLLKDKYKDNIDIYNLELSNVLENNEIVYEDNFFDYIILADVIQKYMDPWNTLKNLSKLLKKDGSMISSIPNFTYISIINQIINGRFTYTNDDVLNKLNLRFFTLEEIQKLFEESGYNIKSISSLTINLDENSQKYVDLLSELANENSIITFNIFQYVIKTNLKQTKTLFDYVKRLD